MRLGIVSTIWGRPDITEAFLHYWTKVDLGVPTVVVAVGDEPWVQPMCKHYGVDFVAHPNDPFSDKWNAGCRRLLDHDVDAMLVMGSDDFADREFVEGALDHLTETGYAVPTRIWFLDHKTGRMMWRDFRRIGAGRVVSREILERLEYRAWLPKWFQAPDGAMDKRVEPVAEPVLMPPLGFLLDVKTGKNIMSYSHMNRGACHPEKAGVIIREKLPLVADFLLKNSPS